MGEGSQIGASYEEWNRARQVVKSVGDLSTTFTSCVRAFLNNDVENRKNGTDTIGTLSSYLGARLLNSPTVISHLYYAALTYCPEKLEAKQVTPIELIELIGLRETAALLTILYFHRRISLRAGTEDWQPIADVLQLYVDIAAPLGSAIPAISPVNALLVGASKFLAWGAIMANDKNGFKKYKVAIKVKKVQYDLALERENWGTDFVQISSAMFQAFGFGVEFAGAYMRALSSSRNEELSEEEKKFKVAQLWLDALVQGTGVPQETVGDDFTLSESQTESFIQRIGVLEEKGSEHRWLMRTKEDLGPDKTPKLNYDYSNIKKFSRKNDSEEELDSEDGESGS